MKKIFLNLVCMSSASLLSFTLAGDIQNLFREINADVIAQQEQTMNTGGFAGMDETGKIINKTFVNLDETTQQIRHIPHGISEIGIERTPCFGSCPAYSFTIMKDGSFTYSGTQHVEHIGSFTGTIPSFAVNNVFVAIDALDYMTLQYQYTTNVLDSAAVYTKVVKLEETKVIENYAMTGPAELLAVELLIDSLIAQINWADVRDEASY